MNVLSHKELTQDDLDMYYYYKNHGIGRGYFLRYFDKLKSSKTSIDAFRFVNDEFYDLFGEYRYSCVQSFRKQLKKYLEK